MHCFPGAAFPAVSRVIDLAHARIEAGQDMIRCCFLGERERRAYPEHPQSPRECQALYHATTDAQPGEGPGPLAIGNSIQVPQSDSGAAEQHRDRIENQFRMALAGLLVMHMHVAAARQREREEFGGSFYGQQIHACRVGLSTQVRIVADAGLTPSPSLSMIHRGDIAFLPDP